MDYFKVHGMGIVPSSICWVVYATMIYLSVVDRRRTYFDFFSVFFPLWGFRWFMYGLQSIGDLQIMATIAAVVAIGGHFDRSRWSTDAVRQPPTTARTDYKRGGKRADYIKWDEFFMFSAAVAAQRSKDPCTQVGAVIVNRKNRIVSSGYNGFCDGISDDNGKWRKDAKKESDNKYMYVVHAEVNAIVSAKTDCSGCTMYVTHHPCHDCAKIIVQSGITRVVYGKMWGDGKSTNAVSSYILETTDVDIEQYVGRNELQLVI